MANPHNKNVSQRVFKVCAKITRRRESLEIRNIFGDILALRSAVVVEFVPGRCVGGARSTPPLALSEWAPRHLIKTAVAVRKHLERNRKDKDVKCRLILIESRIHRLPCYYKFKKVLAPNWKDESSTASAFVA
uniref:small ribosomal subunit protein uS15-like n=1 Tax=Pristiophorus japonicus TaxID=55135 RepID=UPI00398F03F9